MTAAPPTTATTPGGAAAGAHPAGVRFPPAAAAGPAPSAQKVAIRAKGVLNQGMLTPSGFGETYGAVSTLLGRRGSVVLLERVEWGDTRDGSHSGPGSWKILRGTGQYRRLAGAGRGGSAWLDRGPWSSRYEGFLGRR